MLVIAGGNGTYQQLPAMITITADLYAWHCFFFCFNHPQEAWLKFKKCSSKRRSCAITSLSLPSLFLCVCMTACLSVYLSICLSLPLSLRPWKCCQNHKKPTKPRIPKSAIQNVAKTITKTKGNEKKIWETTRWHSESPSLPRSVSEFCLFLVLGLLQWFQQYFGFRSLAFFLVFRMLLWMLCSWHIGLYVSRRRHAHTHIYIYIYIYIVALAPSFTHVAFRQYHYSQGDAFCPGTHTYIYLSLYMYIFIYIRGWGASIRRTSQSGRALLEAREGAAEPVDTRAEWVKCCPCRRVRRPFLASVFARVWVSLVAFLAWVFGFAVVCWLFWLKCLASPLTVLAWMLGWSADRLKLGFMGWSADRLKPKIRNYSGLAL